MAIGTNACEAATSGTVTTANSGADGSTPFTLTNGMTYQTSVVLRGSASVSSSNPGSGTPFVCFTPGTSQVLHRWYQRFDAVPASGVVPGLISYTADTYAARVLMGASGAVSLQTKGSVTRATSPSSTIAVNTWYRFELYVEAGTTASTGSARLAVYEGHSTTPLWDSSLFSGIDTAGTTGSLNFALSGKYSNTSYTGSFYLDDVAFKSGTDASWGAWPAVSSSVPTASAGGYLVVAPGDTFTLDGTASFVTGGSIASWEWEALWPVAGAPDLSSSSVSQPTGTAQTLGDVYVYNLTITDNNGGTDEDTVNVLVAPSGASSSTELVWNGTTWA